MSWGLLFSSRLLGQPALPPPGCIFIRLPIKLSYNTGPSVTSNFCCSKTELRKLHTSPAVSWLQSPFAVILELKKIKEYIKAVYCHPDYLTYMQNTSCEMPGWMKPKLELRLMREISINSDMHMTPSYGRKRRRTKES